jgi:hypothetical protein
MYEQALKSNNAALEKAALGLLVTILPSSPSWILGKISGIAQHYGDWCGTIELLQAIAEQDFAWSQQTLKDALRTLEVTSMWFWRKRSLRQKLESRLTLAAVV